MNPEKEDDVVKEEQRIQDDDEISSPPSVISEPVASVAETSFADENAVNQNPEMPTRKRRRIYIIISLLVLIVAVVVIVLLATNGSGTKSPDEINAGPSSPTFRAPSRAPSTSTSNPTTSPSNSPTLSPVPPASLIIQQLGSDIDGESAGDHFGRSVAMSSDGNTIAVGAVLNDGNGDQAGHVRVFRWTGEWQQVGLDLDGEGPGDRFGISVALSSDGSRVAIGGYRNDGNGEDSGHVRIFDWILKDKKWQQVGSDLDGEAPGDRFGRSVSLSSDGNRIAIGSELNDGNGNDAGHVRVFEWTGGPEWQQVGPDLDGAAAGDHFGVSTSLSADGNRVAIGGYLHSRGGARSGQIWIFDWVERSEEWLILGSGLGGEAPEDLFGWSVSLSSDGSRVAVGADSNDGNGENAGHVRVFEWTAGKAWRQVGEDLDGENAWDSFGTSVALSADGNRVAIGARWNGGNGFDSGHVRVYDWVGGPPWEWQQVSSDDIDGEAAGDEFGWGVALSSNGDRVAVGATRNDGNGTDSGHVRVFEILR